MAENSNAGSQAGPPSNEDIAKQLERIAELLEGQDANPFRVQAYRRAAETLRGLDEPAHAILAREGIEGLERLPYIGERLARSIEQYVTGGGIALLEHLQGAANYQRVLASVPGIGPKLAGRIYDELGVETLEDLEAAAYDGRLAQVEGFGSKRIRGVREALAGRLGSRRGGTAQRRTGDQPTVAVLLDLDREYREKAAQDQLPRIAPRRLNPGGEAWLPVLNTERNGQHYSLLFSNTARAHELGTTRDWVVIYRDDRDGGGQWTVVTANQGSLKGKRAVRGRERECEAYYADS
ncbi:MAG: helix-hairpin-helix domain-containing protein [Caldilineaceae bacterium]